jgi:DNA-binding NarL/FixJ family response regulator
MPKDMQPYTIAFEPAEKKDENHWKARLLRRRYHFPASGSEQDLAVRVDHEKKGFFFPLGTADEKKAAERAGHIHKLASRQEWKAICQQFTRELIVSFEWCENPLMWTYTTIHTLIGEQSTFKSNEPAEDASRQRVLVVELDDGIRRALCWSINQQPQFKGVPCDSKDAFTRAIALQKPHLVILNRNLAGPLGHSLPGAIAQLIPGVTALTYSVHADGDQMFASTPGGAAGYLIKRIEPNRLLDPILNVAKRPNLPIKDALPSVKSYFQALLQSHSDPEITRLPKLSRREREVLALLSKGWVDKEIAQTLRISVWTVHDYVKSIFERLKVHTRTEAVARYFEK